MTNDIESNAVNKEQCLKQEPDDLKVETSEENATASSLSSESIIEEAAGERETSGKFDDDTDVISYVGAISRDGYIKLTQIIENKVSTGTKKDSLILVLTTSGGDPDYGYRIGRAINHYYEKTTILIPDICKSAGTLVAIAGKSLVIGDLGELGPLDIQFRKTDEMGEQSSTLNIFKTVNELQNATLESFRHFVTDIRYGSGIGTKLSAEIASNLTKAMISPIAAQIDPIKLGEHNRALQIAKDYATRLNETADNLISKDALQRLVSGYPCHSFVIDRKEAQQIFKNVSQPSDERTAFIYLFARHYLDQGALNRAFYQNELHVIDFQEVIVEYLNTRDEEDKTSSSVCKEVDDSSKETEILEQEKEG